MLKPDTRYAGTIVDGGIYEANSGTLGYQLLLNCEDGATDFVIWLTKKTKENGSAEKAFVGLGVDPKCLRSETGLEGIASQLAGMEVVFGTRSEEYNGKTRVKVSWVGKPKEGGASAGSPLARAAAFFADATEPDPKPASFKDDPDSVPF